MINPRRRRQASPFACLALIDEPAPLAPLTPS
jgi:hypothetical protein